MPVHCFSITYFLFPVNLIKYIKWIPLRAVKTGRGYPHDGRADKDSYPHDGRADNTSYHTLLSILPAITKNLYV